MSHMPVYLKLVGKKTYEMRPREGKLPPESEVTDFTTQLVTLQRALEHGTILVETKGDLQPIERKSST